LSNKNKIIIKISMYEYLFMDKSHYYLIKTVRNVPDFESAFFSIRINPDICDSYRYE